MPIEIRELIVKAVVSNEEIQNRGTVPAGSGAQIMQIEAALEQIKKIISDSKER